MVLSWSKYFNNVIIPAAVIILFVNFLLPVKEETDVSKIIENAWTSGNYHELKDQYNKLIEKDLLNTDYHIGYLSAHYSLPKYYGKHATRHDGEIELMYRKYAQSDDKRISDIGRLGLSYFYRNEEKYEEALKHLGAVKNRKLKYLNSLTGSINYKVRDYETARKNLYKEIELKGDLSGACFTLSELLFATERYSELSAMIANPGLRDYIPYWIIRLTDLHEHNYADYLLKATVLRDFNLFGFTGALLILIVWFNFLKKVDVFEPEPLKYTLPILFGGMFFSLFAIPLYDFLSVSLNFQLTGNLINDLLYCILGIGIIEEALKVIPVLLLLRFTKAVNESVDYIIYGSISALGFAFMENLLYFQEGGLINMTARAVSSVLLHMSLTSIVVYGLFYSKYKEENKPVYYFFLYFCSAVVLHGLFDYFLVAEIYDRLRSISYFICFYCIFCFINAINCSLNFSEFQPKKSYSLIDQTEKLSYYLSAIILFQYLVIFFKFGASNANRNLGVTVLTSFGLLMLIVHGLGRFEVRKFKWIPIFEFKNDQPGIKEMKLPR